MRSQYIEKAGLLGASVKAYPDNVTIYIAKNNVLVARILYVLEGMNISSKDTYEAKQRIRWMLQQ